MRQALLLVPLLVAASLPSPGEVAVAASNEINIGVIDKAPNSPYPTHRIDVATDAWASSAVNVTNPASSTLFTEGDLQFAAYYNSAQHLVLARRKLGSDHWKTQDTGLKGNASDGHNGIAMAVDGAGFLHIAWDHHNSPLRYARSTEAGSLDLEQLGAMTGEDEEAVTYPMFFRMQDGNLLFLYRNGASGEGNLVLKHYDTRLRQWTLVQENLVSGEGERSAYVSADMDSAGTLHLAWTWRESPDVATNHDLCYARSKDGGKTWTDSKNNNLSLPITAASAEYAARIPQNRSLMNPPSIDAGWNNRIYIVDYWKPEGSDVPQWHLVHSTQDGWKTIELPVRKTAFELSGENTKHPPISRAALAVLSNWGQPDGIQIIYRSDAAGQKPMMLRCADISQSRWTLRPLSDNALGAWEPSYDPIQWHRHAQIHMLMQKVEQRDGDDSTTASDTGSPISTLIWSPVTDPWSSGEKPAPLPPPDPDMLNAPIKAPSVLSVMEKVADWQIENPSRYDTHGWEVGPFWIGVAKLASLSLSPRFHDAALRWAEENNWEPGKRFYHADDLCVIQAYLELNKLDPNSAVIEASERRLKGILEDPPHSSLHWGTPNSGDRWSWCDALFMAPAGFAMLADITGEERYLEYMDSEWWETTRMLYRPDDGLYLRDGSFKDLREPNGERIYWSRGDGWAIAGLCRVIDNLPKDHPRRSRYITLYRRMVTAVLDAQQPDGLWRPGLLDPETHAALETSGSSFYVFALAWGINRDVIQDSRAEEAVQHGWNALVNCVTPAGKLEHVQPVGLAPITFDPHHNEPFAAGAFLLAGTEVYRLYNE